MNSNQSSAMSGIKSAQMSARIIRADGTVEELGVVAYHHKNPIKRWVFGIWNKVRLSILITLINRRTSKGVSK